MAPKPKQAKKGAAASHPANGDHKPKPQTPNWPPFHPLVPSSDLGLATLLPDQILTISRFWTTALCKTYVSFLGSLDLTTTPGKPKKGDAVRVNDRYQIDDPAFAERLWSSTALKELVANPVVDGEALDEAGKKRLWGGEVLGLNSNIRIYRYSKGQFFDQHCKHTLSFTVRLYISVAFPLIHCTSLR